MKIQLLWFEGCPNHEVARALLREVLAARDLDVTVDDLEVPDEATGERLRFPGSPTIRVAVLDVEPDVEDCDDCSPRCRLYHTRLGLRGVPERAWIEAALDRALTAQPPLST